MMEAQELMDRHHAWDYNAEIKTILSKLGINHTTKKLKIIRRTTKTCCLS